MGEARIPHSVVDNIRTVIAIEEEEARRRSLGERLSDGVAGFVGTIAFVGVHLAVFAAWVVVNVGLTPLRPFDPYPFAFLCMFVSLESVLLSTFVLIKQNRMSLRSDRRSHLDLQINLLTEKEVTTLLRLLSRMAERMGLDPEREQPETRELEQVTAVDELARDLQRKLPEG